MSYTTAPAVQELMARIGNNAAFSAFSVPKLDQVNDIIANISAEVDVHLASAGYTVPVTTPAYFLTWLGQVNAFGAAAVVLKSAFPESVANQNGGTVIPAYSFYEKKYQDELARIDAGTIGVPGTELANGILPSSYLTVNPTNGGLDGSDGAEGSRWGEGQQPVFGMNQVF